MKYIYRHIYLVLGLLLTCTTTFAQFSTCDVNLINAHLNPAGYTRVFVPTQPCSMYFNSATPKSGIDAHRDAANLGIPQLVIDNIQENNDVSAALFAAGVYNITGTSAAVWLGITDSSTIYSWRTFTGAPATFFNWTAGDPNNLRPGCYNGVTGCSLCTGTNAYWCAYGENCAVMRANGEWLDNSCTGTTTGNPGGPAIVRVVVLELNTCPVINKRDTTICAGNPVTLTANVVSGGTPAYTYSWNPGAVSGPSITVSPTTSSTYTVHVEDHYLCKADSVVRVTVNTPIAPTINGPANVCKGANANISLSTVSGTATYAWSFGAGSNIVSGTNGGPYSVNWSIGGTKTISVTVTDGGCSVSATRSITVDSADAAFTLSPAATCTNQNVTATITTPSATAIYAWGFGGGTSTGGPGAGPYSIQWATAGTKTVGVTVTDHSCTATASATVSVAASPTPAFTLNPATTACQGEQVAVTLTGATSPTATYAWNFHGGNIISGSGAGPYSISWNTAGLQSVDLTVTDGGCPGTAATQSITITGGIVAAAGADLQQCPGTTGQLGAAPAGGYTYSWTPATGLSSASIADPTVTIPANTTGANVNYTYVVTTSSGSCSAKDTVVVTSYPTPVSGFTINPTTACAGTNVNITYSGTPSGTATYAWNFNGGTVVSGTNSGPYTVTWPTTGPQNVELTVTENGCSSTTTHTVTIGNAMTVAFTVNPTTACIGEPVTVTVTSTASGAATYAWNWDGGTVISGTTSGPYTVSWPTVGTKNINLTVTDGGCSGTATQSVTIANTTVANAGVDVQLCPTIPGTLGAPAVSGYTYSWSPTFGLSSSTAANPSITIPSNPTGATIDTFYILTATSGSCSATDTVRVTIYPDLDNNFVVSSLSACTGQDITITYAGTVSATATYTWSFDGGTVASGSGAGPYTVNWATQGNKNVTLNVIDNGCSSATPGSATITVGSKPTAVAGAAQTTCSGASVQLGAAAASGVTYTWSPAANLSSAAVADPTFAAANTTGANMVYNYMLIASAGCSDTAYTSVTVTPVSPMTILASGPLVFCDGGSVVLSDDLSPQADYLWSTTEITPTITVTTSGSYTLTAHDAAGCQYVSSAAVVVTVNSNPTISLAPNGQVNESCSGDNDGSLTVQAANGTPNYSFIWNTTPPQNGPSISALTPGSYDVAVSDANGCVDSATYTITPAPYFAINIDSVHELTCTNLTSAAIYASTTGGALPVSYFWSTTQITPAITQLTPGTYSVTATDARGCMADSSIVIARPTQITFVTTSPNVISYGGSQQIEITISPTATYTYSWSPAGTLDCAVCPGPVASPLQTTIYYLTVTDPAGGCTAIDTVTIFVDKAKNYFIPNAFTPNNDGINDTYQVYASGPVKFFEMNIFDRWGERMYLSNDIGSGWDGKYKGVYASNGEYVYVVTITFMDGQTMSNKGSLTLIK